MANFLEDNFTEAGDTSLEDHTPDVAGGQWPNDWDTANFQVEGGTGYAETLGVNLIYGISEPDPGGDDDPAAAAARAGDRARQGGGVP